MAYTNIDGITVEQFNDIIGELEYYGDEIYYMEDFNDVFSDVEAYGAILATFHGRRFGYPRDYFNPYDEFFTFDGYDNLMSIPENSLQEYMTYQFKDDILYYVNTKEIRLDGVEEADEDGYLYTSECGYLGELFEKPLDK